MKTLTRKLKEKQTANETIVVPYIMAGAQGLFELEEEIKLLAAAGASAIELGIPFSDPVADGSVIQQAGLAALAALAQKVTLKATLQQLKKIHTDTPLVIMTYFNPIFVYGLTAFLEQLAETEVKGLIIPDLPYEHRDLLVPLLAETDICLIPLVALTTPKERIQMLVESAEGFVYAVAVNGVTGMGSNYQADIDEHLAYIQSISSSPVLSGFDISTIAHVERFSKQCAGVVVGSKLVQLLSEGRTEEITAFIKNSI